jgi:PAS domain S-box-containing protein
MKDGNKTKSRLIAELAAMRKRVARLERLKITPGQEKKGPWESKEKYRVLLENASDAIIITDAKGNFLEANRNASDLLGYSRKEFVGMSIRDIHPEEELERIIDDFSRIAAGEIHSSYDTKVLTKDGKIVHVDITGAPIEHEGRTLVMGIFRDITERKQVEEALNKTEKEYRAIFENTLEAIYQTTMEGQFLAANPAAARILGYDSPEALVRSINAMDTQIYANPGERDEALRLLKEYGVLKNFEVQFRRKDGSIIWGLLNARSVYDEQGNALYIEGTCQDITERKETEEELIKHRDKLGKLVKERTVELEAKSKTLKEVNAALKVLLKQKEEDREELEEQFVSNIRRMIFPYIAKMQKGKLDVNQKAHLDIISTNLNEILSPFFNTIRLLNFTPKEIEVASFIKDGKTTKEIAEIMDVATSAIDAHRNNIRAKLGLNKKKANLHSYLLSLK